MTLRMGKCTDRHDGCTAGSQDHVSKAPMMQSSSMRRQQSTLALQSSAVAAAKRGYVDNIIAAEDTRKYVIGAFEMLFTKRDDRPSKKHGTV